MTAGSRLPFASQLAGWRPTWRQAQALAFVVAAGCAYNGARILNASPRRSTPVLDNFDVSMPWLGAALLALVVAAWLPGRALRVRREAIVEFWRAHWLELLVFAGIFAFGVFMRVYRFQTTLPPADGICCEEAINGGVGYRALEGERPLNFLLTRWGSAFGFLVFGENTLGLRFFFVVMSIVTLIVFYLLLRELVSVPVALFGMALYSAAWWPSLRARQASEGTIYTVLFALVLVRGLKTKHPLFALCAGVLAGLLSYEYEPFKAVPIIAAIFLGAAAAREVALRAPFTAAGAWARARAMFNVAWQPTAFALMATAIVLVPMIVGTHRGHDLYLTSVHRQERGREGDRIAEQWRTQLKWEAQIFAPIGPNEYPTSPPRDVPDKDLLDPLTAWLALAGLVAGAMFLLRGFRGLFAGWVAISLGAGALLLSDFGPWKFMPLVPVFIALSAYFLDDARWLATRRFARHGALGFGALLVAGAAFSFWWNANTLFRQVGPSRVIAAFYGGAPAMIYSTCHHLQGRGDGNYAIVHSMDGSLNAFAQRRDSADLERRAWGDFIWACHGLQGDAVAAAEEMWPLRDLPAGPLTLLVAGPPEIMDERISALLRAYPSLGAPAKRVSGPGESFYYVTFELAGPEQLGPNGLSGEYVSHGDVPATTTRVDDLTSLSWEEDDLPLTLPFSVRWSGLVYVAGGSTMSLHALTDEPVDVRLDGEVVYSTRAGEEQEATADLIQGWHAVEITLDKQHEGGDVSLEWISPSGRVPVSSQDLFPLVELVGWQHERSLGVPGDRQQQITQRLDFAPHLASAHVLRLQAQTAADEPIVMEERWHGVWHVEEGGNYVLRAAIAAGTVLFRVDGAQVGDVQAPPSGPGEHQVTVPLQPGPHSIEIVQELDSDVSVVGLIFSAMLNGQLVTMNVTPY